MFSSAIASSRFSSDGKVISEGKVGLWPFTQVIPAKYNSNRLVGTPKVKNHALTKEIYKKLIIARVFLILRRIDPVFDFSRSKVYTTMHQYIANSLS